MTVWTISVPNRLAQSLEQILDEASSHDFEFLVSLDNGFKIEIFADEHSPPHFHVKYKDEQNTFRISDATPMHSDGLNRYFRHIRKWHVANREKLIEVWNTTRPSQCPVGRFFA